jgi:hypothetical protein
MASASMRGARYSAPLKPTGDRCEKDDHIGHVRSPWAQGHHDVGPRDGMIATLQKTGVWIASEDELDAR